ncbi:MAG: hypothetical protein QOG28_4794, partial [Trebonia sp.]|nr:hypothetical protein [Trebonia sp.]
MLVVKVNAQRANGHIVGHVLPGEQRGEGAALVGDCPGDGTLALRQVLRDDRGGALVEEPARRQRQGTGKPGVAGRGPVPCGLVEERFEQNLLHEPEAEHVPLVRESVPGHLVRDGDLVGAERELVNVGGEAADRGQDRELDAASGLVLGQQDGVRPHPGQDRVRASPADDDRPADGGCRQAGTAGGEVGGLVGRRLRAAGKGRHEVGEYFRLGCLVHAADSTNRTTSH